MPNIMVFGSNPREVDAVECALRLVASELGLTEETIITVVPSTTISCAQIGGHRPYIRVCGTDRREINNIVLGLKQLDLRIDCEWLLLGGFISAEEMIRA